MAAKGWTLSLFHLIFGKPRSEAERPKKPNSLVINLKTSDYGLEYIEGAEGRQFQYEGASFVYWFIRDKKGVLSEVEIPPVMKQLPERLYRALECKAAEIVYTVPLSLFEKFSYGMVIGFGCLALFILYLMMTPK